MSVPNFDYLTTKQQGELLSNIVQAIGAIEIMNAETGESISEWNQNYFEFFTPYFAEIVQRYNFNNFEEAKQFLVDFGI